MIGPCPYDGFGNSTADRQRLEYIMAGASARGWRYWHSTRCSAKTLADLREGCPTEAGHAAAA